MPLRRTLLILGACWLVLSTAWVARRWRAVRILDKAEASGVYCHWQTNGWLPYKWERLLPTSRIIDISVDRNFVNSQLANGHFDDGPFPSGRALAWAVRRCGAVQYLRVSHDARASADDLREVRAFLLGLDQQPELQVVDLTRVALKSDEIVKLFGGFPAVQKVGIHYTPLSDEGLAAVLRSTDLRQCWLVETAVTPAGVRQVPQWKQKALKEFVVLNENLSEEDCKKLQTILETTCPDVKSTISNSWVE
jgi:hypothetical protein